MEWVSFEDKFPAKSGYYRLSNNYKNVRIRYVLVDIAGGGFSRVSILPPKLEETIEKYTHWSNI